MTKPKLSSQLSSKKKTKPAAKDKTKATRQTQTTIPVVAAPPEAAVRLPGAWQIISKSFDTIWSNKKLFLGIAAVYGVLNIVLVRGFSTASDLTLLKGLLSGIDAFTTNIALLAFLVTASGEQSSDVATTYQVFLVLVTSLALVWALRQVMSGNQVRIRDAFYKGMHPLVPVILLILLVVIQLLPLVLSAGLYNLLIDSGIAATTLERVLWAAVMVLGGAVTLFFLPTSITALYVATLPDMTPVKALRSARELIRGRRLRVLMRLLFLPVAFSIAAAAVMLAVIAVWITAAPWVFFALSMVGIVVVHAYLYTLYRELLA